MSTSPSRMVVTVEREHPPGIRALPPNSISAEVLQRLHAGRRTLPSRTPDGKKLLEMKGWSIRPCPTTRTAPRSWPTTAAPPIRRLYVVGATFASPDDEHYYGLGQNQEGFLDHRGHPVRCWNDYTRPGRAQLLRAVPGHQQGLRPAVGQPLEDHHRARLQRADALDLAKWATASRSS